MTSTADSKPLQILLVEDNPADARMTQETIKHSDHPISITIAEDGNKAVSMLRHEGEYANFPRPDLILLDLRLPGKDGPQILHEISSDPNLVNIPVVILTSTEAERSFLRSHNIPPSRYCQKPLELHRFHLMIGQLGLFSRQPVRLLEPQAQTAQSAASGRPSKKRWWPF